MFEVDDLDKFKEKFYLEPIREIRKPMTENLK